MVVPVQQKYMVVQVTDLKTRQKTFKIYEHPARTNPPLFVDIPTRAKADAMIQEMLEKEREEAMVMAKRDQT